MIFCKIGAAAGRQLDKLSLGLWLEQKTKEITGLAFDLPASWAKEAAKFRKLQDAATYKRQQSSQDPELQQLAQYGAYYGAIGGGYTYEVELLPKKALVRCVHSNGQKLEKSYSTKLLASKPKLPSFQLDPDELTKLAKHPHWQPDHLFTSGYVFEFTPTGLGTITKVQFRKQPDCPEADLTDYDTW